MGRVKTVVKNLVKRVKAFFGGRPKQKALVLPSSNYETRERVRGKDRRDRWESRPALCKWQNIPVRAVNTYMSPKEHALLKKWKGVVP